MRPYTLIPRPGIRCNRLRTSHRNGLSPPDVLEEYAMARSMFVSRYVRLAMAPVLAAALGMGTACVAQVHNDHKSPPSHQQGNDFHFRDQDRQQFQSHYKSDINRYHSHPHGRQRQFSRGQRALHPTCTSSLCPSSLSPRHAASTSFGIPVRLLQRLRRRSTTRQRALSEMCWIWSPAATR